MKNDYNLGRALQTFRTSSTIKKIHKRRTEFHTQGTIDIDLEHSTEAELANKEMDELKKEVRLLNRQLMQAEEKRKQEIEDIKEQVRKMGIQLEREREISAYLTRHNTQLQEKNKQLVRALKQMKEEPRIRIERTEASQLESKIESLDRQILSSRQRLSSLRSRRR